MNLEENLKQNLPKIDAHIDAAKKASNHGTLVSIISEAKQAVSIAIEMDQEIYNLLDESSTGVVKENNQEELKKHIRPIVRVLERAMEEALAEETIADINRLLGAAYFIRGRYGLAEKFLLEAQGMYSAQGKKDKECNALEILASVYERRGFSNKYKHTLIGAMQSDPTQELAFARYAYMVFSKFSDRYAGIKPQKKRELYNGMKAILAKSRDIIAVDKELTAYLQKVCVGYTNTRPEAILRLRGSSCLRKVVAH